MALAAVGVTAAGAVACVTGTARLTTEVERALTQEVQEFRSLRTAGLTSASAVALQVRVPDRHEALFGVADGRIASSSRGGTSDALRNDARFLRALAPLASAGRATRVDVDTGLGQVRVAVEPVSPRYAFVVAYDVETARTEAIAATVRTYALIGSGVLGLLALLGLVALLGLAAPAGSPLIGRISRAARRARQEFLDDAGHELRTPITIMRGAPRAARLRRPPPT